MPRRHRILNRLQIIWSICLLLGSGSSSLWGQETLLTAQPGDELYPAESYIKAGLYDRALPLLQPMYDCLLEQDAFISPQGIRVRQLMGRIFQQTNKEDEAVAMLLPLIEDAARTGQYREQVHAMLTLSSIYAGSRQYEKNIEILNRCFALIHRHQLASVYARYLIRRCNYFSSLRQIDSIRYYAHRAFDLSTRMEQPWEQAHAYTLLSDAYPDTTYLYYLENLRPFVDYHRGVENYLIVSQAFVIMVSYLRGNDRIEEAKLLSDSTIFYLDAMERRGQVLPQALASAHRERMWIFEALGQADSALYHAQQYIRHEIAYREERSFAAVREVEAKYADDVKADKIRLQEVELKQRHREQLQVLLIAVLIGIAALLLFYFNRKLERVNRSLADQSAELEQTNQELETALEHQELLRGELHHRVKNNLQVIISMLELQEWNTDAIPAKNSLQAMSERVYSIASVHELLYPDRGGQQIDFKTYLNQLCNRAAALWPAEQYPDFKLDVPEIAMNLDTLVPLGIVMSELLTNTRKYFGSTGRRPRMYISLQRRDQEFCLEYRDNGPGFPNEEMPERKGGLGRYLLAGMSRQLQGRFETYNADGAVTRIFFRLKNMALPEPYDTLTH